MLEVKSEMQMINDLPSFVLYMKVGNKDYSHCAMNASNFSDPFHMLNILKVMIEALAEIQCPELNDPITRAKQKLKELESEKAALQYMLQTMESK